MYKRYNVKLVVCLLAVMAAWGAPMAVGTAGADSAQGMMIINDGMRAVEIEDGILYIDLTQSEFMTSKEITVKIGPYKEKNEVIYTRLLDADGRDVNTDFLQPSQRVQVKGYKVDRTVVFAKSVQVMGRQVEKEHRTIRKLSPLKVQ